MRTLNIVCGIAVILVTLHFAHGIHHFLFMAGQENMHGPLLWISITLVAIIWIASFIGGCLLLRRSR